MGSRRWRCALAVLSAARACQGSRSSEVLFAFEDGLEGWAAASSSEMQIDVTASGGVLRGSVHGGSSLRLSEPHMDSPLLALTADGRQSVALRMRYQGTGNRVARWRARYGVAPATDGAADHGRADWTVRGPASPVTASAINDGDVRTWWGGSAGASVTYSWLEAEAGATALAAGTSAHAVTELEFVPGPSGNVGGLAGSGPRYLLLQSSALEETSSFRTVWETALKNGTNSSLSQRLLTGLLPDLAKAAYWRVVFVDGAHSGDFDEIRVSELRLLPAVTEVRFGLNPSPEWTTYVVPLWRRAAVSGLMGDFEGSLEPLKLTRLRLYLGDALTEPAVMRSFDTSANDACIEWTSQSAAASGVSDVPAWASSMWRLVADYERAGPWIVSELTMFEDAACTASLTQHVDYAYPDSHQGALASSWVTEAFGDALYDGVCGDEGLEASGEGGSAGAAWVSGAAAHSDRAEGGTWLGYAFERRVAVRCVALCQTSDAAGRAESLTLQRSQDEGLTWTDHATLALTASANLVVANPCDLKYVATDFAKETRRARFGSSTRGNNNMNQGRWSSVKDAFEIESIRIVAPPVVRWVTGCVDKFWPLESPRQGAAPRLDEDFAVTSLKDACVLENGELQRCFASKTSAPKAAYATTFNCPVNGGLRVELRGERLGTNETPVLVTVGGKVCSDVEYVERLRDDLNENSAALTCTLPSGTRGVAMVKVSRRDLPQLFDAVAYLAYQEKPVRMAQPSVSNVAARSVDLAWLPPRAESSGQNALWAALATSGYVVHWRAVSSPRNRAVDDVPTAAHDLDYDDDGDGGATFSQTLGNVTSTTVVGLEPGVSYVFAVAACNEDRGADQAFVDQVDLYGRRALLNGALVGPRSLFSQATATLALDVQFTSFDANATVKHGAADARATNGPSGLVGGEGSYGLLLVGAANVENCNASHACCDNFDLHQYVKTGEGCAAASYACLETKSRDTYERRDDTTKRGAAQNSPLEPHQLFAEKRVQRVRDFSPFASGRMPLVPSAACGPALRLTSASPREVGAVWYARRLNVREGFDTSFVIRATNPSVRCDSMEGVHTWCRSRGADGFAFVVQEDRPDALGNAGAGLGYDGINNSLAVEFDSHYNHELLEPYENHVSVHSRGWRLPNSARHEASFASTTRIPDIATADGSDNEYIAARVVYDPVFDPSVLESDAFSASPHVAHFFANAEFAQGGLADFGAGVGTLSVYVDDLFTPVLITPVNVAALLRLHHGRAWVGFTAATGLATWQVHDLLQWNFTMLRKDPSYHPPPLVDGAGAHACVSKDECVHA